VTRENTGEIPRLPLGAYGLALEGLSGAAAFMQPQSPEAPTLQVHVSAGGDDDVAFVLTPDRADLPLIGGGRLQLVKGTPEVHFLLPKRPSDEELLHPYLAPAAALFWQWSGREALHAGAFGTSGGAVLILGDKEAGKSTTLGWLASEGTVVLTDDLAIMDGASVVAGPRSIDLRVAPEDHAAAHHLVRNGERDRVQLDPGPDHLPLAGTVVLDWGPELTFTPVPFDQRLTLIARQRTFHGLAPNPVALLEVASRPMVRVSRPRQLARLAEFGKALLDYFA
jgi:hypothetical protein